MNPTVLLCRRSADLERLHDLAVASGLAVVGLAQTVDAARDMVLSRRPNLLICEPQAAEGCALALVRELRELRELREAGEKLNILIDARGGVRQQLLWDLLCAGADSCWTPDAQATLAQASAQVLQGGASLSQAMARRVLDHFHPRGGPATAFDDMRSSLNLSRAERDLLVLLAQGERLDAIAQAQALRPLGLAQRVRGIHAKLRWAASSSALSLAA